MDDERLSREDWHKKCMSDIFAEARTLVEGFKDLRLLNDKTDFSRIADLADLVKSLEAVEDQAKIVKTLLGDHVDFFKKGVLPEMLTEQDVRSMKVEGTLGKFNLILQGDMYVNIPAGNKQEVLNWLKENGYSDMVKEDVSASTFGAFVKTAYNDGTAYPEELIKTTPYSKVTIRKA